MEESKMKEESKKYEKEEKRQIDSSIQEIKPIRFIVGPDGFLYKTEVSSEKFDKRYYGR